MAASDAEKFHTQAKECCKRAEETVSPLDKEGMASVGG